MGLTLDFLRGLAIAVLAGLLGVAWGELADLPVSRRGLGLLAFLLVLLGVLVGAARSSPETEAPLEGEPQDNTPGPDET